MELIGSIQLARFFIWYTYIVAEMQLLLNKVNIKLAPQSEFETVSNQFLQSFGSYFGHQVWLMMLVIFSFQIGY